LFPIVSTIPIIGKLLDGAFNVIDQVVPDKDLAARLKSKLKSQDYSLLKTEIQNQANIVLAEVQGKSWLQRNWRPGLMVLFGYIIANNYIIAPMFGLTVLPIPPDMWQLLKIGIGGYTIGRSAEKVVERWKR